MIKRYLDQLEGPLEEKRLVVPKAVVAFRNAKAVADRLSLTLARPAYPRPEVLDDVLALVEDLKKGDFSSARQRLLAVQNRLGHCDEESEAKRSLEILARLIYLLVKDQLPTHLLALCGDEQFVLTNADWLLEKYGTKLVFEFFAVVEDFLGKRLAALERAVDFLARLDKTKLDPCALHLLVNDVASVLLWAELEERKKEELRERASEDVAKIGVLAKDLAQRSGVGSWGEVLVSLESVKVLGQIAKEWLSKRAPSFSFPSPSERDAIYGVRR